MQTLLGIKQGQGQRFLENGTRIPVTVVRIPQNTVLAVKTVEKDGYSAMQIGMGQKKNANKPLLGHAKKANLTAAPKVITEVKTTETLPQGEFILVASVLAAGDIINVSGTSKGKGFAGGVKRYGFRGGPRTHGQSDRERAPGSLGQTTTPGRVYKGKRMAGHMGSVTKTVTNLLVVDVREQEVLIKGLVPGNIGNVITITKVGSLPEKKIVALLPDPFAPAPQEEPAQDQTPDEVSKEEKVSNVSEGDDKSLVEDTAEQNTEAVALDDSKIANTAETSAQPAEDSAKQNSEEANSGDNVEIKEETKEEAK